VVVGVDERPDEDVLRWAAGDAAARGVRLCVCLVWEWSGVDRGPLPLPEDPADIRTPGEKVVAGALDLVRGWQPDLPVSGAIAYGRPAVTLITVSDQAAMVVMGARGTGGFRGLLTGSVAGHVAAHARCPVAVVGRAPAAGATDVVVGVDGSAQSYAALRLGVFEARRFGGALIPVHAYRLPPLPAAYGPNPGVDAESHRVAAEERLDRALAGVETDAPDVKMQRWVVHGAPAAALADASDGAAALVVGARGLGGFAGLVLGSVSQQVIRHAPCPVVVAR
jgi:nucleotide-binding universal stress UspA family protein